MKNLFAAALMGLLLTPGPALAGDEDGSEAAVICAAGFELISGVCFARTVPDAGSETEEISVMDRVAIEESTTSSAGGVILPILFLVLIAAAVAD